MTLQETTSRNRTLRKLTPRGTPIQPFPFDNMVCLFTLHMRDSSLNQRFQEKSKWQLITLVYIRFVKNDKTLFSFNKNLINLHMIKTCENLNIFYDFMFSFFVRILLEVKFFEIFIIFIVLIIFIAIFSDSYCGCIVLLCAFSDCMNSVVLRNFICFA